MKDDVDVFRKNHSGFISDDKVLFDIKSPSRPGSM